MSQYHRGRPAAALDTSPLKMAKMQVVRTTFGANLALTAPEILFWDMVGGKLLNSLGVCMLKMLRISQGIQICMQNMRNFSDPRPPPSSQDSTLHGAKKVFCVQNDQFDEGIILRYVCWGT